jgi:hypothetical protein
VCVTTVSPSPLRTSEHYTERPALESWTIDPQSTFAMGLRGVVCVVAGLASGINAATTARMPDVGSAEGVATGENQVTLPLSAPSPVCRRPSLIRNRSPHYPMHDTKFGIVSTCQQLS